MEKILVIDDAMIRSNTVEVLCHEGFHALGAENGRVSLEVAKKYLPDLITSDILMPEMDGYGVLEGLQNAGETSSIPFIFLSARTSGADIRQGILKGTDDYLLKPFKIKDLLDTVNSRLKHRHIDTKLEELYDCIGKFLPHELRTPLVLILGFSEYMKDYSDSITLNEITEMAVKINTAGTRGNRLYKIVQKLLQYSCISSLINGKEQLQQARNAYIPSIQDSLSAYAISLAKKFRRINDLVFRFNRKLYTNLPKSP